MKLRPLGDRVIVKRIESETKTASGIVIPDSAAEKPDQGEVLAVGPGEIDKKGRLIPNPIEIGQRIRFGGMEDYLSYPRFEDNGEELIVMSWKDVCFVEADDAKNH